MAITRRDFLAGSAVAAGFMGLAGCAGTRQGAGADPLAAPAADKYPIEPDKGDVTAKYASEEVRDGWTRVTNEDGGAVLGAIALTALVYGVLAVALGAVRREDLLALPKGEKIADKLHLR